MVRDFTVACIALFIAELSFPCRGFARQSIDYPLPGAPGYEELAHAYDKLSKGELEDAVKFAQRARRLAPDAEAPVRLLTDVLTKLRRLREAFS